MEYGEIIGVDEAGRGPLAGPVVASAVIVKNANKLEGINDSKKLSEKKREHFFDIIMENCEVGVGIIDQKRIDKINILNATFEAMGIAVNQLNSEKLVLVDGNKEIKGYNGKQKAIVKGDGKSLAIASASVIAKVTRDRIMKKYAEKYPEYSFEKHKGYGTKLHREKLLEIGPCEIHRESFLKKILKRD
ncbi:MAG: ribonuclease HII [Fusobacteriia bacterium 4572_132]|nr:MAG: ribonuclease HII [Fusobacteriia bacterium 4572_132]